MVRSLGGAGHARDAEVGQLDAPAVVEHHVGRLDVAVHHALLVREGQRVEQFAHDAHSPRPA
jgi:hypothetical protein